MLKDSYNKIVNDFSELYDSLKEFIKNNGGYISTTKPNCDKIYSLEFVGGGEVSEWDVLAVKVENDTILYCAEYGTFETEPLTEEELFEDDDIGREWYSLANSDNYYFQTIFNIAESIEQYVD